MSSKIIITIDNREHDLIQHITSNIKNNSSFQQIELKIANLPIGDIILSNENNDFVVIERKTLNDLLSSIKDGRYEEQSYRLNGSTYHNHNIIYLIEGDINKINMFKNNRIDKVTLYSSIFSLNYYKGFSVLRTMSIEETAFFICNCANKLNKGIQENKNAFYKNVEILSLEQDPTLNINLDESDEPIKSYSSVIKKVKKENITPENISEIMLCQIPGISSVTACIIMEHFKTFPFFMSEIQTKGIECLQNVTYKNNKNQTRKLNKTCISNILRFLSKT